MNDKNPDSNIRRRAGPLRGLRLLRLAERAENRGATSRAERLLKAALEHSTPENESELRYRLGRLLCSRGLTDRAEAAFRRALANARAQDDRSDEAWALNGLAVVSQRRGKLNEADRLWSSVERLAELVQDHRLMAMAAQNRGVLAATRGDFGSAMQRYRTSLSHFARIDDNQGVAWVANNLGMLSNDLRRFPDALRYFDDAITHAREADDLATEGLAEGNRAITLRASGRLDEAIEGCRRANEIAIRRNDTLRQAEALKTLSQCFQDKDDSNRAEVLLSHAFQLATAAEDELLRAEILAELGTLRVLAGQPAGANEALSRAEAKLREIGALLAAEDVAAHRSAVRAQA